MNRFIDKIIKPPVPFYNIIFLPLFYALSAVYYAGTRADHSLSSVASRYIGIATLDNIDITARVSLFYLSVILFAIAFSLLFVFINRLVEKKIISPNELLILNITSFCGVVFLYTRLFGTEIYPGLRMLAVIHIALFLCVAIRNIFLKKPEINLHFFSWMVIISFCFLFAVKKFSALLGSRVDFSFTLLMGLSLTVLLVFLRKQLFSTEPIINPNPITRILEPLVWLPLLSVISDEIYLILNQRGVFNISPLSVFAVLFLLVVIFTFLRKRNLYEPGTEEILSRRYFPVLIAGLSAFSFYTPVQNATSEMFEIANGVLPVQQLYEFGKIPLVDTFSSHMLSDSFLMFLYSVFNGDNNLCFSCYDFIFSILFSVIVYYAVRKLTGSSYWAFFIALFYPYAEHLIPSYVSFALVPLLVLINSGGKKSTSNYLLLFFIAVFLIIWRIDLGYANAFAMLAAVLLLFAGDKQVINRKAFFKAFLWVLSAAAILMLFLFLIKGKNILYNIQSALDYFSSAQSYGSKDLASRYDVIFYSLHYFFPVLILAATGYAVFKFFTSDSAKTKMLCIALCYLSVFYFLNFQRGLVRHGLQELWDIPVTSFAFLIFMIAALIFFEKKNLTYSFVATTALMTLLISRYKFPEEELKKGGVYNSVYERIKHFPAVEPSKEKINRMTGAENFAAVNYPEIENFMNKNFLQSESFADFSNTPMLYYYLHRKSPHFFSQSPISYHSEKLQMKWIKEIEQANSKVILFSSYPETWYDITDGVPNPLRHYIIAEYLFSHYHPGYILNDKTVWLRNDVNIQSNNIDTVYSAADIKTYTLADAFIKDGAFVTGNNAPSLFINTISIDAEKEKKYFLAMNAENLVPGEEKIYFYYNDSTVPGKESKWKYSSGGNMVFSIIPVSPGEKITGIRFSLTKNSQFIPQRLDVVQCDYVPDYYSTAFRDFDLKQLAYVWGNKDVRFKKSKHEVLREVSNNRETIANYYEKKFLFSPVAKSDTGCYVIMRARKKTDDKTDIVMNYGEGNKKSGGFSFNIPTRGAVNYVIRVSTQYNWYNRANNWITVYPMGGDVEIEKIQIISAD